MSQSNSEPFGIIDRAALTEWREGPHPDPSTLSSAERLGRIERYRTLKQSGVALTIEEMKHVISLMSADRAESVRRKSSDSKAAKGATKAGSVYLDPDDL